MDREEADLVERNIDRLEDEIDIKNSELQFLLSALLFLMDDENYNGHYLKGKFEHYDLQYDSALDVTLMPPKLFADMIIQEALSRGISCKRE